MQPTNRSPGWADPNSTHRASSPANLCELAILYRPAGLKAKRLALAGAGKRDKFDANEMRKAVGDGRSRR